jgi:heat shock protein HslJ
MRMRVLLVAALLVALPGCRAPTAAPAPTETPSPALQLDGTEWQLHSINGEALAPGSAISLEFADGRLGGTAGCNHYGGEYSINAQGELSLGMIAQTVMLCLDEAVMKQESAYMTALQSATAARLDAEGRLELRGEKGALLYVQRRWTPPSWSGPPGG